MSVPLHTAADDVAFQHVERGEQRGVAVVLLVMRHGAAASALERQTGLGSVERPDLALFVDRHDRQDHCMRRWIDIRADDVAQLGGEVRIVGRLELRQAVRLQPVGAPDALHRADADADLRDRHSGRPMRRLARRRPKRQRHDLLLDRRRQRGNARQPRLVAQQTTDAGLHEPLLPAPDSGLGHARQPHDGRRGVSGGGQQHHAGAPNVLLRAVTVGELCEQPLTIFRPDVNGDPSAHAHDSHTASRRRNPKRTPPPDFIH
jgi:hypothetical protein